jgi:hypothetical protein
MLPLAWFYIALVAFLWALLFYLELREHAKQHVKGCPSLPYISAERLDSFIVIEPDLIIVELSSRAASRERHRIPDSIRVPIDQLDSFLNQASHRAVFVFYDSATEPAEWSRVESILNRYTIPYVFVLKGGLEAWLRRQQRIAVAS